MYNYPKNGKVATLADLITMCLYKVKYSQLTGVKDLYNVVTKQDNNKPDLTEIGYGSNNYKDPTRLIGRGYELIYTPNIYKRRTNAKEKATILIPSDEELFGPARTIKFNSIIKTNREDSKEVYIPIHYALGYLCEPPEGNAYLYFDYKMSIGNNLLKTSGNIKSLDNIQVKNITNIDVSSISGKKYGGNDDVLLCDLFLLKHVDKVWLMEARQDISTAIEPYQSGDIDITWSGLANIYYTTGESSIIEIHNEPLTLYGVKNLGTNVWPVLGEDLDGSTAYDICQYDLTALGRANKGYEELEDYQKVKYGINIEDASIEIFYPADCWRGFDQYYYTDLYGKKPSKIISTILHLYRKGNYIDKTLFYNIDMHLEVYLGGVNYNLYPTMGYGQKIGDTTTQSKQNKRLIPWQGETVYLLTYFTYNGESYHYRSGNRRSILFNDVPAYEFNQLYFYVQDLTTVNFYASLAGEAVSYASVNTASIQIPMNGVNLERTLTLSVVFVDTNNENIEAGKTTSIEFKQEANPNIQEGEHKVIVYSMSSITNPNESNSDSATGTTVWNWVARMRMTLVDPTIAYLQDETSEEEESLPTSARNPFDNEEDDLYSLTLDDILYSAPSDGGTPEDDSSAYTDSSLSNYKTFYVSANTTSDNLYKYPAKYFCGTILDSSSDSSTNDESTDIILWLKEKTEEEYEEDKEFEYPHDLDFDIELNAFTFSSIQNSYYFNYFTVEKDPNVILLINYFDLPNALDQGLTLDNINSYDLPEKIENVNNNGILDIEDWNATELHVGETATSFNLVYNEAYKGYPLYIRPKFRTYKYTLNVTFLHQINLKDNFYYIIKFKFKYLGAVIEELDEQWNNTNILSTDNDMLNDSRSTNDDPASDNKIYDTIIKAMVKSDVPENTNRIFDIRSYMPIDVDNKVYFPKKIDTEDVTATTYSYMFICNSQDLKEYIGIPIYGTRLNDRIAYSYNEFISLPLKIKISATFEILWFIKGTAEQVTKDTHQYEDSILYSFDNETFNVVNTGESVIIELDYYNKSVVDTILSLDNITMYIKNVDIPIKYDPIDKNNTLEDDLENEEI